MQHVHVVTTPYSPNTTSLAHIHQTNKQTITAETSMSLFAILFTLALSVTEASRSVIYYGREFRQGNVHRTSWDSSQTYNLKRTLHMHKGEVGYTVKNYLGQDVIVTEPFDFGKTDGQIWRTCPEYSIRCERGYKVSPSGFGSISLPWKYTDSKFADKFASTRCQIPPRCVPRDSSRRLRSISLD